MAMTPTSSRNTPDGLAIFNSDFAAFTAARAALRIAEITPERPALIPATRPFITLVPALRSVELFRLLETAERTPEPTLLAVPEKL